ncbi:hypothetical protein BN1708_010484 [Verticillium longisporum]|uniref:Low temperature requirement protein A n=1 Tax=Verticillium longisporum TaxID=100787 RepID=A0A0G4KRU3_VERLO|nr:hypothetical protein BN1708_010484 [Verticillium longisporum]
MTRLPTSHFDMRRTDSINSSTALTGVQRTNSGISSIEHLGVPRTDSSRSAASTASWGLDYLQEEKIAPLKWIKSPVNVRTDRSREASDNAAASDNGEENNKNTNATTANEVLHLSVRENANTIELFSDLFFIANLETFTSAHSVNNVNTLVAYISFFSIIWFTWFQITLHDVRFSLDSGYERVCKLAQFCIFVGFAFVGSSFDPEQDGQNNQNFRILCHILLGSRLLMVIQYSVALHFVRRHTESMTWPLSLTIATLVFSGGSFLSMTVSFNPGAKPGLGIYYLYYVILGIEAAVTLGISIAWRKTGFKRTHLTERMGLLTLVIIGEGAIGATKTVGKVMGNDDVRLDATLLIACMVFILLLSWMLYFDNPPECNFGSIRQQVWAVLHFPFHLGMIGIVEGSQQIILAWHVLRRFISFRKDVRVACIEQHLDGTALVRAITRALDKLKLADDSNGRDWLPRILDEVQTLGNTTDVCSLGRPGAGTSSLPPAFDTLTRTLTTALADSVNPSSSSSSSSAALPAQHPGYMAIYAYYWGSLSLALVFLALFILITRRADRPLTLSDRAALAVRAAVALTALGLAAAAASERFLMLYLENGATLPTVATCFLIIVAFDRWAKGVSASRLRRELTGSLEHWDNGSQE